MKTCMAKTDEEKRAFYLVDVKDKVLGRAATRIASILKGKHKANITPHVDVGDAVIVINADKIRVTGKKLEQKLYKRFSGYPGGLKLRPMKEVLKKRPEEVIGRAVKGMLPKNKLGKRMFRRLKVYAGDKHPHKAQDPKEFKI